MLTEPLRPDADSRETYLPLLRSAQNYLQELLNDKVPNSLLANAWDEFFGVYDDLIRRFVISRGVPSSDVDDCVQEVWSEVAARLVAFDRPADRPGLRSWLYTLVRSKTTNVFRKRARQRSESLDEQIAAGAEPSARQAGPAEEFDKQWERTVLQRVREQLEQELSSTNRRILQMRLIELRRVEEVAAELNLEARQVYARYHRIMKKLRARVALYTGGPLGAEEG